MYVSVIFQVALSVAAEFWEQGDLERTVLEQQPIVSLLLGIYSLSYTEIEKLHFVYVWLLVLFIFE